MDAGPGTKTSLEPAASIRLLVAAVTSVGERRQPSEMIEISPVIGVVRMRFADNAYGDVGAWAEMFGMPLIHREVDGERRVGSEEAGVRWGGWVLHFWCGITTTEPEHPDGGGAGGRWPVHLIGAPDSTAPLEWPPTDGAAVAPRTAGRRSPHLIDDSETFTPFSSPPRIQDATPGEGS
ncbi:hypothetical protein ACWER9_07250 [Micromonospora sp. NPDC003944]